MSSTTLPSAAPPAASDTAASYRYWQRRILISSIVGYALFYFVRKNLSLAMPGMAADLGITKTDLGLFLTLHGVLYGVSKFVNGFVGDRVNARYFMSLGLLLSALANLAFGFGTTALVLGTLWVVNGWVQGMGFPPCARLLTHWFPPSRLATKMSVWNTSHSIGAGLVVVLCGYLVTYDWRLCFWVPGLIALVGVAFLLVALRDTPESMGLPPIEAVDNDPTTAPTTAPPSPALASASSPTDEASSPSSPRRTVASSPAPPALDYATPSEDDLPFAQTLWRHVFSNPTIWLIALATFFVYVVRYAVLDWGPMMLKESKGIQLSHAGWMVAAFELSGVAGMLAAGWITDRLFGGRGARTCVFYMAGTIAAVLALWKLPPGSPGLATLILCCAGFLIYGPQALTGIIVANLATKRAAASAVGLTGIFAYASTLLSGVGLGYVAQHWGWPAALASIAGFALTGTLLFLAAWPAQPHGYARAAAAH